MSFDVTGVFSGMFWGLGYGGGAMFSGMLVEFLGVRTTYQFYAAVAVPLCLLLFIVYWSTERRKDGGDSDVQYQPITKEN